MSAPTAGHKATERITVDRDRTIGFMGEEGRVYATPALVGDIEMVCRNLLLEQLEPGQDSVGTRVEIDHLAATLEGMWVEIDATIEAIDGRSARFVVVARDAVDKVADCRHTRFIVDVEKTKQRLAAKAAKAGTA